MKDVAKRLMAKGHQLYRLKDGEVDYFAFENDKHNGPRCVLCDEVVCLNCEPDYEPEKCPGEYSTDPALIDFIPREIYRKIIGPIRNHVKSFGYAITVHGSLQTDIDLVAVPWTLQTISPDRLLTEVVSVVEEVLGYGSTRENKLARCNHNRLTCPIYTSDKCHAVYIDFSIIEPEKDNNDIN